MRKGYIVLLVALFIFSGCSGGFNAGDDLTGGAGYFRLKIDWPGTAGGDGVRAIPDNFSVISVEVTGLGITSPRTELVSYPEKELIINNLPAGNKVATIKALDSSSSLLSQRKVSFVVYNGTTTDAGDVTLGVAITGTSTNAVFEPSILNIPMNCNVYFQNWLDFSVTVIGMGDNFTLDGAYPDFTGFMVFDGESCFFKGAVWPFLNDFYNFLSINIPPLYEYAFQIEGRGIEDGGFCWNYGITSDLNDNIFVADWYNYRIQQFNVDGQFVTKWGKNFYEGGRFFGPVSVGCDNLGNIYVGDGPGGQPYAVLKYDSNKNLLTMFGRSEPTDEQIIFPWGIVSDNENNIYIVDSYNKVQKRDSNGIFITHWGSLGSANGQFSSPHGIARGISGCFYVSDTNNYRVQKFSSDFSFLTKFGSGSGSGNNQFRPWGLAVDAQENIIIGDSANTRIVKLTSSGSFITKWASIGGTPTGCATDSQGNIYVSSFDGRCVVKYTGSGDFVGTWKGDYERDNRLIYPMSVSVDSSNNIYVIHSGTHCLKKFNQSGQLLTKWGSKGTGNDQFLAARKARFDGEDNLYVLDINGNRIKKYDSNGNYLLSIGSAGSGNGNLGYPFGLWVDNSGDIFVADTNNNRIQKFSSVGQFLTKWGSLGSGNEQLNSPRAVCTDVEGNIYIGDTGNARVMKYSFDGQFIRKLTSSGDYGFTKIESIWDIVTDSSGNVYVGDGRRVLKTDSNFNFITSVQFIGDGEGKFWGVMGIWVDPSGNLYVVDHTLDRLIKYTPK